MKRLLPLVFSLLAWPAHAACPAPAEWARTFQQAHADFHVAPDRDEPSLFTPAFDAALRREWNYAQGEVGHLDYDPWLGAQDGEIGGKPVFETESETRGTAIVAMRYPFVLEPGGPRTRRSCTWCSSARRRNAGAWTTSSPRWAIRCNGCMRRARTRPRNTSLRVRLLPIRTLVSLILVDDPDHEHAGKEQAEADPDHGGGRGLPPLTDIRDDFIRRHQQPSVVFHQQDAPVAEERIDRLLEPDDLQLFPSIASRTCATLPTKQLGLA
ncbi:hypothetical protein WJ972_16805 [Achromobacter insuavis]